jgi:hypothetical protein
MVVNSAEPGDRLQLVLNDAPGDLVVLVHPAPREWSDGTGDLASAVLTGLTDEIGLTSTPEGEALRLHWHA